MLQIYLASSMDLNYAPMYLSLTSSTHGHSSPYLRPGTWVLTSGSLQMGLKWFVNCQPMGHCKWVQNDLSTFGTLIGSWVPGLGPGSRVLDPGPGMRSCSQIFCLQTSAVPVAQVVRALESDCIWDAQTAWDRDSVAHIFFRFFFVIYSRNTYLDHKWWIV